MENCGGGGVSSSLDKRYPPNWDEISDFTIAVTRGRCGRCFVRRATLAHHMSYPPYWLQKPLISLIPLCSQCHGEAHRKTNWNKKKRNNHPEFAWKLRLNLVITFLTTWFLYLTGWLLIAMLVALVLFSL